MSYSLFNTPPVKIEDGDIVSPYTVWSSSKVTEFINVINTANENADVSSLAPIATATENSITIFSDNTGKVITDTLVYIDPLTRNMTNVNLINGVDITSLGTGMGDVTISGIETLTNKTIDSDLNTITNIVNADIKTLAAIDSAKLADGTVSNTEFQYINSLTSNAQTQINDTNTAIGTHSGITTLVHGISDTANLVYLTDVQQLDNKSISGADNTITLLQGSSIVADTLPHDRITGLLTPNVFTDSIILGGAGPGGISTALKSLPLGTENQHLEVVGGALTYSSLNKTHRDDTTNPHATTLKQALVSEGLTVNANAILVGNTTANEMFAFDSTADSVLATDLSGNLNYITKQTLTGEQHPHQIIEGQKSIVVPNDNENICRLDLSTTANGVYRVRYECFGTNRSQINTMTIVKVNGPVYFLHNESNVHDIQLDRSIFAGGIITWLGFSDQTYTFFLSCQSISQNAILTSL